MKRPTMKIEYPQIDWEKIAKECPKALKAFYDSDCVFKHNAFVAANYKEGIKQDKEYITRLALSYNTCTYEIIIWMQSMDVIAYAEAVSGWRPVVNNFVVNDGTNSVPNGLTYQENLAIAIEKGFEVIEQNIMKRATTKSDIDQKDLIL